MEKWMQGGEDWCFRMHVNVTWQMGNKNHRIFGYRNRTTTGRLHVHKETMQRTWLYRVEAVLCTEMILIPQSLGMAVSPIHPATLFAIIIAFKLNWNVCCYNVVGRAETSAGAVDCERRKSLLNVTNNSINPEIVVCLSLALVVGVIHHVHFLSRGSKPNSPHIWRRKEVASFLPLYTRGSSTDEDLWFETPRCIFPTRRRCGINSI